MRAKLEVDAALWLGIVDYLKALHICGAVDDTKMKFESYYPLEECMKLWGIEPFGYPIVTKPDENLDLQGETKQNTPRDLNAGLETHKLTY